MPDEARKRYREVVSEIADKALAIDGKILKQ
jgi:hypothetical protein